VRTTSEVDSDVSGRAQCRAIAGVAPPVLWIPLALASISTGAAIFAISYFRYRARAVRRLRVLRDIAAASKTR
jgi:hypothetical protein